MSAASDLSEYDERLENALADYLRSVEAGQPLPHATLLAQYPDLAEELESFFRNREFMDHHASRLRHDTPARIGDYELLEVIGSGAFGVVFKARHVKLGNLVAIKLLRAEQGPSPEDVKRIVNKDGKTAKLKHDNIVSVYDVGEYEGQQYFLMELIDGDSLAKRLKGCTPEERATRGHQRWAAELIEKVAWAMHHAHQALLIHRDLKPGNILLDSDGQPHITDFGLAKQIDEGELLFGLGPVEENAERWKGNGEDEPDTAAVTTKAGLRVGTAAYMSPEQAAGRELTTSDVYSLGVILYEMLAGRVPIRGATTQETLQLILTETPPPLAPRIDHRLGKICMKCLEKDPQDRYLSAHALARNLERWLANEPIIDPPDGFAERCRLWCRRNPALAGLLVTAALLLVFVLVMAISVARARAARLEQEVLKSNTYAAQGVADRFLLELQNLSKAVEQTVVEKQLPDLLEREDKAGLQTFCEGIHARYDDPRHGIARADKDPPFESWYLMNARGNILALTGREAGARLAAVMKDPIFQGRDYFHGAMGRAGKKGRGAVHISRIYKATEDGLFRFGISAAVHKGEEVVGVVVATVITDPTMGLDRLHDDRRKAVLYGPKDPNPPREKVSGARDPSEFVILVHPAYHRGGEAVLFPAGKLPSARPLLDGEELRQPDLQQTFNAEQAGIKDYVDPVGARHADYQGRWLAGFAPVGNTELVVIVQQRYDDAIDDTNIWTGAAVLLGVLLILAVGWLGLQAFIFRRARP